MTAAPAFRFEAAKHEYFLGEDRIPSITQLIERGGLLGTGAAFYTEASRDRGTDVHSLCTDYDLGALDLAKLESPNRGYALAYVEACRVLQPAWTEIEEADAHPGFRFAGRVDRVGTVMGRATVAEIKTAVKAKHHAIQTALQAILKAPRHRCDPMAWQRMIIYVKNNGRYSVEVHEDPRDFDVAKRLIREFC